MKGLRNALRFLTGDHTHQLATRRSSRSMGRRYCTLEPLEERTLLSFSAGIGQYPLTQPDPTSNAAIHFKVEFGTKIDLDTFATDDIDLSGSTVAASVTSIVCMNSGTDTIFDVTVTAETSGTVIAYLSAGVVSNIAGTDTNAAATLIGGDNSVTYTDTTEPTVYVALAPGQDSSTNAATVTFFVTFSEEVSDFDLAHVSYATNLAQSTAFSSSSVASIDSITPTGTGQYTVTISGMDTDGTVVFRCPAEGYHDLAGNPLAYGAQASVTYDATAPAVSVGLASGQGTSASTAPIQFQVTFSEAVTNFDIDHLGGIVLGGTAAGATVTDIQSSGANTYTVSVGDMTSGGTVTFSIAAGAYTDAAGNGNTASPTSQTVTYTPDTTKPSVYVGLAAGQETSTSTASIQFKATFSEAVTNFDMFNLAGIVLSGTAPDATVTDIQYSGANVYTVTISEMTSGGTVTFSIAAGVYTDAAGNTNTASPTSQTVIYTPDTTKPSVTVGLASGQGTSTSTPSIQFKAIFSEAVTNFDMFHLSGIVLGGTAAGAVVTDIVSSGANTYTVSVGGMTTSGTVTFSIAAGVYTDEAGNTNTASPTSQTVLYTLDTVNPTVTVGLESDQEKITSEGPILFEVVFSEEVTDFDINHLDGIVLQDKDGFPVLGAMVDDIEQIDANTYVVSVEMTDDGTVTLSIDAGAYHDEAGNANNASTIVNNGTLNSVTVTYDTTPPEVVDIESDLTDEQVNEYDEIIAGPIAFLVTFDEPVVDFDMDNLEGLDLSNSTTQGAEVTSIQLISSDPDGGEYVYRVLVGHITSDGIVQLVVLADSYHDEAGNANEDDVEADEEIYNAEPLTVMVSLADDQADVTNSGTIQFMVAFSEPVIEFDIDNIDGIHVSGTAFADLVNDPEIVSIELSDGAATFTYIVTVQGMTQDGTVQLDILADQYYSEAGDASGIDELNAASSVGVSGNTVLYDATAPTVTIYRANGILDPEHYQAAETTTLPIHFTFVFSEAVTGFDESDIIGLPDGAFWTVTQVDALGTIYDLEIEDLEPNVDTTFIPTVRDSAAEDAAGNQNAAATADIGNQVVYNVPLTVTVNQYSLGDPTNASTVYFVVQFSEAIDDASFTTNDVTLGGTAEAGASVTEKTYLGDNAYRIAVNVPVDSGTIIASVDANKVTSANGAEPDNDASTSTDNKITIDRIAPTATINQAVDQQDPVGGDPATLTVYFIAAFSEAMNPNSITSESLLLDPTDVNTLSWESVTVIQLDEATYVFAVTGFGPDQSGVLVASLAGTVVDEAGNTLGSSTSTDNRVTVDTSELTTTVAYDTIEMGANGADKVMFTVTFSSPVSDFDATKVFMTGSTAFSSYAAPRINVTGSGTTYTVTVSGMNQDGSVRIRVPGMAEAEDYWVHDEYGNPNADSGYASVTYDRKLTVQIEQAADQADPTSEAPIYFLVQFSTPVSNFTTSKVLLDNGPGAAPWASVLMVTNQGYVADADPNKVGTWNYIVTVSGMTGSGTVEATVKDGEILDASGQAVEEVIPSIDNKVTFTWQPDTVALYDSPTSHFYLKNSNATGFSDIDFLYGQGDSKWIALSGDWDGDGVDTIGMYDPEMSRFYLRNTNDAGIATITFSYGPANDGWMPIIGDWDGDGDDTVGLYNAKTARFYLRDDNTPGMADNTFAYGPVNVGWKPIAGDWNGNGIDTIGLFNPKTARAYLRNTNTVGIADVTFAYGPANRGWKPITGDWNGDGIDTLGLYDGSTSIFYLRNTNTIGVADLTFSYGAGNAGFIPLVGTWVDYSASNLLVAGGAVTAAPGTESVTLSALQPFVTEAITRWIASGASESMISALQDANVVVADLAGDRLGMAEGDTIYIDADAAGYGWFVDSTPTTDEEFSAAGQAIDPQAVDRIDLLTVVAHELGHIAGFDDLDGMGDDLMNGVLGLGTRRNA